METMFFPPDRFSHCTGTHIIASYAAISLRLHRIAQSGSNWTASEQRESAQRSEI
jgi:hypothetical protein